MSTIHEINEGWQEFALQPTWAQLHKAQTEYDELRARVVALEVDAARYRWLRSAETGHCKVGGLFEVVGDGGQFSLKCTEELDAAIDAAMKGE